MIVRGSPVARHMLTLSCLLAIALGAAALEVPLTYETRSDEGPYFPHGYQGSEVTLNIPEGEWKLPELVAERPAYATLELGDTKYLLVFDVRKDSDKFYNRLYFDANANRDLTDDPVIAAMTNQGGSGESMHYTQFQPVEMTVAVGESQLPYRFVPSLYCFLSQPNKAPTEEPNLRNMQFNIRTACAYRGSLDLDGAAYDIWLGDSNGNGKFQERFKIMDWDRSDERLYATGDTLYVVKKGEQLSYETGQILGDYLVLRDKVFEVSVRVPDGRMDLTPVTENLAALETPAKLDSLQLCSEDGAKAVTLIDPGLKTQVPANRYRLASYRLLANGEQGDHWTLRAMGASNCPVVAANAGQTASIALGEPFSPVVKVAEYSRGRMLGGTPSVTLEFEVRGAGEEYVAGLERVSGKNSKIAMSSKNPSLPAEPSYKIVSGEGELVTGGTFEYG